MKLNIGCGNKPKEDHINIDLFDQNADRKMDACNLEFEDNCAESVEMAHLIEHLEGSTIVADIHADAGTYIKELIHSDKGRTSPSISSFLGKECTCTRLDVIKIDDGFLDLVIGQPL